MNIAYSSIYNDFFGNDRLFDEKPCSLGQNLLSPFVKLKKELEKLGHQIHTVDFYENFADVDFIIFQDLYYGYSATCDDFPAWRRYILKGKWRHDYLREAIKNLPLEKRILIMMEPPIISPSTYNQKHHKLFHKILTWNDDLVDEKKYFRLCYAQPVPDVKYNVPYDAKKFLTMVCGNKKSSAKNELYSKRKDVIEYCGKNKIQFDLYGYGWRKDTPCYCGSVDNKIETLSHYKYSVCYENMTCINGYITEKIFDCFFAGCVPVYWGADNVTDYIPEEAFIDRRNFASNSEMISYLNGINETEYEKYLSAAEKFIESQKFQSEFSVDAFVQRILEALE